MLVSILSNEGPTCECSDIVIEENYNEKNGTRWHIEGKDWLKVLFFPQENRSGWGIWLIAYVDDMGDLTWAFSSLDSLHATVDGLVDLSDSSSIEMLHHIINCIERDHAQNP